MVVVYVISKLDATFCHFQRYAVAEVQKGKEVVMFSHYELHEAI